MSEYLCIAPDVKLGEGVKLSRFINLYGCEVGDNTKIGAFVEIQKNAKVGKNCKISSHTFICEGVTIEDNVFVGHGVSFINDSYPRATAPNGALQTEKDWKVEPTRVRTGASIGSGATILANVPCSMIVEEELEKIPGTKVQRVRVGDVFVCEAIRKYHAEFAMEISSHYFLPEFYIFDDPVLMALKVAQEIGESGKKLSELSDEIPSYPFVEKEIPVRDDLKFKAAKELVKYYKGKGYEVDTTDGAKIQMKNGWGLLRASNTQPMIRLFAEAKAKSDLSRIVKELEKDCARAVKKATAV